MASQPKNNAARDASPAASLARLLNERDLADLLGRSVKSIRKDRLAGIGAPFIRIGRQVRYRPRDVEAWLAALQTRRSTSEPARVA